MGSAMFNPFLPVIWFPIPAAAMFNCAIFAMPSYA
jgi:hypothetical protein